MSEPPAFTVNDNREDASTARIKMIHELHAALYGDSGTARDSPGSVGGMPCRGAPPHPPTHLDPTVPSPLH